MELIPVAFRGPPYSCSFAWRSGFCILGGIRKIVLPGSLRSPLPNVTRPKGLAFRLTAFLLIAIFHLSTNCYAECCTGEIKPKSGATSQKTYVWDGKELKPKSGATAKTTWVFDGKEVKKKSGATASSTYLWTGSQFMPKSGATSTNTWTWSRNELKRLSGVTGSNTWKFDRCEWTMKQGATSQNSWVVTGFVPIPISALVILGLN